MAAQVEPDPLAPLRLGDPDRTVLVTGAAQGIGQASARWFGQRAGTVAVNDRVASPALTSLADELGGIAVPGDISDVDAMAGIAAQLEASHGGVDVLVANAAYMTMAPLVEADPDDWWRVLEVNLLGTFACIQAVVPGMLHRGSGRIVVVTSEWGVIGWPDATAYCASKAGLVSLVKTLGRELAPHGVIVNGVAPSVVDTPQLDIDAAAAGMSPREMREQYAKEVPVGRLAHPDEIAATIGFLADERLGSLVGQVVACNGGTSRTRV